MVKFKPMLAGKCSDINTLNFPVIASPKLDGVRALTHTGESLSRALKPFPNKFVQLLFSHLPNGLDGELIAGHPCAPDAFRKTTSIVMSHDAPIDDLCFHVFDCFTSRAPFNVRLAELQKITPIGYAHWQLVPQFHIGNPEALLAYEERCLGEGYEGVMIREPNSPYKFGRSTEREGYLLKLKRFADSEAEVIGVVELMHNGNEAKTNALGRTERSTAKAGKTGMGVMGALQVRDVKTGVEFEIGTGFSYEDRQAIWKDAWDSERGRVKLTNQLAHWRLVKYKYFAGGSKDKPRFPVFLGWRDKRDL